MAYPAGTGIRMKKAYIRTFGCQMNDYDSERILYLLWKKGYMESDNPDESDIIIFNTCAVREKARTKLYGHMGNLRELKKNKPGLIICVGGCTAQNLREKLLEDFPFIDIVFGTHNLHELPSLIDKRLMYRDKKGICSIAENGSGYDPGLAMTRSKFRALVPVSIGCNNFCTYCIVPYVRGREISLDPGLIIENVKKIARIGIPEVILLGQNVNSYGNDLKTGINFCRLLDMVSQVKGLRRVRFMTSHPKDFSPELIDMICGRENIMNHVHLPLQAGSDRVLKMMNRKYTRSQYMDIAGRIRELIPECSITTDIITGFPGEERIDFEQTLEIVEKVRFNRAFTFIYSPRQGTGAEKLNDKISPEEKRKWFTELLELQNRISLEKNMEFKGKIFKVLVEGTGGKDSGLMQGRMENNTIVHFKGGKNLIGKITRVFIEEAKTFYLMGRLAENQ